MGSWEQDQEQEQEKEQEKESEEASLLALNQGLKELQQSILMRQMSFTGHGSGDVDNLLGRSPPP